MALLFEVGCLHCTVNIRSRNNNCWHIVKYRPFLQRTFFLFETNSVRRNIEIIIYIYIYTYISHGPGKIP